MDLQKDVLRRIGPRPKTRVVRQKVKLAIQLKLWIKSGGNCSFRGCSHKLDEHSLTFEESNYSNIAHIIAHSKDGPRGNNPLPAEQRNEYDNLMLVCTECHKLIDSKENEDKYPIELLQTFKREHEEQFEFVRHIYSKREKTHLLRCRANILNEVSQISPEQVIEAISPRFPVSKNFIEIDMTKTPGMDTKEYWSSKKQEISNQIRLAFFSGGFDFEINHLSVFALGPMPLLLHLGNCLSNKISTDLFQRHRDTEKWIWKESENSIAFKVHKIKDGDDEHVCLLLSLSGKIHTNTIHSELYKNSTVYEITLEDAEPTPTFLNSNKTLQVFKVFYRNVVSNLTANHVGLSIIHFFPAVPAPIAVLCGRELLHKTDPILAVYDYNKINNSFEFAMEVNNGRE